jgi:signal transduction histidine kinase
VLLAIHASFYGEAKSASSVAKCNLQYLRALDYVVRGVAAERDATTRYVYSVMGDRKCPGFETRPKQIAVALLPIWRDTAGVADGDSVAGPSFLCGPAFNVSTDLAAGRACMDAALASAEAVVQRECSGLDERGRVFLSDYLAVTVRGKVQEARASVDVGDGCMSLRNAAAASMAWNKASSMVASSADVLNGEGSPGPVQQSAPLAFVSLLTELSFMTESVGRNLGRAFAAADDVAALTGSARDAYKAATAAAACGNATAAGSLTVGLAQADRALIAWSTPRLDVVATRVQTQTSYRMASGNMAALNSVLQSFTTASAAVSGALNAGAALELAISAANLTSAQWQTLAVTALVETRTALTASLDEFRAESATQEATAQAALGVAISLGCMLLLLIYAAAWLLHNQRRRRQLAAQAALLRDKTTFVRHVSHEARSPAQSALLAIQLLEGELLAEIDATRAAAAASAGSAATLSAPVPPPLPLLQTREAGAKGGGLTAAWVGSGVEAKPDVIGGLESKLEYAMLAREALTHQVSVFNAALLWERLASGPLTIERQPLSLFAELRRSAAILVGSTAV